MARPQTDRIRSARYELDLDRIAAAVADPKVRALAALIITYGTTADEYPRSSNVSSIHGSDTSDPTADAALRKATDRTPLELRRAYDLIRQAADLLRVAQAVAFSVVVPESNIPGWQGERIPCVVCGTAPATQLRMCDTDRKLWERKGKPRTPEGQPTYAYLKDIRDELTARTHLRKKR